MKQYTATANDEGVRLSRFVQSVTRDFPTSLLYKSFRNKRIKVNGKKGVPEDRIKAGDLIELYINDEFFPPEGAKPTRKPAPKKQQNQPKVTVIYEDENLGLIGLLFGGSLLHRLCALGREKLVVDVQLDQISRLQTVFRRGFFAVYLHPLVAETLVQQAGGKIAGHALHKARKTHAVIVGGGSKLFHKAILIVFVRIMLL